MRQSKKYPNAIHDHEIEVMVKNVAFIAMLASHMGPTFKQRQTMIIIMFISYTGCIKKIVIELWSALASSLYNL